MQGKGFTIVYQKWVQTSTEGNLLAFELDLLAILNSETNVLQLINAIIIQLTYRQLCLCMLQMECLKIKFVLSYCFPFIKKKQHSVKLFIYSISLIVRSANKLHTNQVNLFFITNSENAVSAYTNAVNLLFITNRDNVVLASCR